MDGHGWPVIDSRINKLRIKFTKVTKTSKNTMIRTYNEQKHKRDHQANFVTETWRNETDCRKGVPM